MSNWHRYHDFICFFGGTLQYVVYYGSEEAAIHHFAMTLPRQSVQQMIADMKGFLAQPQRDLAPLFNELGGGVIGFNDDAQVRDCCRLMIRVMKQALAVRDLPKKKGHPHGQDLVKRFQKPSPPEQTWYRRNRDYGC